MFSKNTYQGIDAGGSKKRLLLIFAGVFLIFIIIVSIVLTGQKKQSSIESIQKSNPQLTEYRTNFVTFLYPKTFEQKIVGDDDIFLSPKNTASNTPQESIRVYEKTISGYSELEKANPALKSKKNVKKIDRGSLKILRVDYGKSAELLTTSLLYSYDTTTYRVTVTHRANSALSESLDAIVESFRFTTRS